MFNNISWAQYIAFIALALTVYYLFVAIKFYPHLFHRTLIKKAPFVRSASSKGGLEDDDTTLDTQSYQPELFGSAQKSSLSTQTEDNDIQQMTELTEKLKEVIANAVSNNYIKEEFFLSLQLLLRKYHFLKATPFLVPLNNLIASECEKFGYIQLSAEERVMLWNE